MVSFSVHLGHLFSIKSKCSSNFEWLYGFLFSIWHCFMHYDTLSEVVKYDQIWIYQWFHMLSLIVLFVISRYVFTKVGKVPWILLQLQKHCKYCHINKIPKMWLLKSTLMILFECHKEFDYKVRSCLWGEKLQKCFAIQKRSL